MTYDECIRLTIQHGISIEQAKILFDTVFGFWRSEKEKQIENAQRPLATAAATEK